MPPPETTEPIQRATLAHASVLAEIHRAAFSASESWSRDVMLLHLELPSTFAFLHPLGGMVLARAAADEAEILTFAVDPARRRRGIGSALLDQAMRQAARLGARSMFLEVAVTNLPARALYAHHGFTETGLRRHYYSDGTDALILRSTLTPDTTDS